MTENSKTKNDVFFIFSAPSGAGKTTIIDILKEKMKNAYFSVSVTTRRPRENEKEGEAYYFVSEDKFKELIDADAFYEYNHSEYGSSYGTRKDKVDEALNAGRPIILDLDYSGVQRMKAVFGDKVKTIFIMPPSIEELRNRLVRRGKDSLETIQKRMKSAEDRIKESKYYDHIVVNDDLNTAVSEVIKIINDECSKKNLKMNNNFLSGKGGR